MLKPFFKIVSIAFFILLSGCKSYSLSTNKDELINIKSGMPDSTIMSLYTPYKVQLDEKMKVEIGVLEQDLIKEKPESNLGNLCARIALVQTTNILNTKIDFALLNYGGMRVPSIVKGILRLEDIYKLMPFDNILVCITLDGPTTLKAIEKAATEQGWPVEGLRFKISNGKPTDITINGVPFDVSKTYKIATIDYLADGGDNMDFLRGKPQQNTNLLFREAIIEYIKAETKAGNTIISLKDGRVSNE